MIAFPLNREIRRENYLKFAHNDYHNSIFQFLFLQRSKPLIFPKLFTKRLDYKLSQMKSTQKLTMFI